MADQKDDRPTFINFANFAHNQTEFYVDFATLYQPMNPPKEGQPEGTANGQVAGRFVMTPSYVKVLAHALAENVALYEKQFGTIQVGTAMPPNVTLN